MQRIIRILILLAWITALLSGCNRGGGLGWPAAPAVPPAPLPAMIPIGDSPIPQDVLAKLWARSDHDDWDVISAMISPTDGGIVSGVPATWPAGYEFSVKIEPGAIVTDGLKTDTRPVDTMIEIRILVPRYYPDDQPNSQHVPVYRLQPHGLQFSVPATVTFCYPPWRPARDSYVKYHFDREDNDGEWLYYVTDYEVLRAPVVGDPRVGLTFATTHFSRWGMQNGAGGDGIVDPDSLAPVMPLPPVPRIQEPTP